MPVIVNKLFNKYVKISDSDKCNKSIFNKLIPLFDEIMKNGTPQEIEEFKRITKEYDERKNKTGKEQFKIYNEIPNSRALHKGTFNPKLKLSDAEFKIYLNLLNEHEKKEKEKDLTKKNNKISELIKNKDINKLVKLSKDDLYELIGDNKTSITLTKTELVNILISK